MPKQMRETVNPVFPSVVYSIMFLLFSKRNAVYFQQRIYTN